MSDAPSIKKRVGLVGARGYTGSELVRLIDAHPAMELAWVSSRELDGESLAAHVPGIATELRFENLGPEAVAERAPDAVILALPNGLAHRYVAPIDAAFGAGQGPVIVDLSADYRFDDLWQYGLPERFRQRIAHARRIANPGCYATGMQMALWPIADLLIAPPVAFGISGYSGAGTTPSPKNDPEVLRDNLLPYSLTGHMHEREVSHQLGRKIYFSPHVAPFFRGIALTISAELDPAKVGTASEEALATVQTRYQTPFQGEPLVRLLKDAPVVRDAAGEHGVSLGGLSVDVRDGVPHLVLVATLDNLLKGAATQALQNLNLALGLEEFSGIPTWPT